MNNGIDLRGQHLTPRMCVMCNNIYQPKTAKQETCGSKCAQKRMGRIKAQNLREERRRAGKIDLKGQEKVFRVVDTLPEDYDMLGVSYDSMTLQSSLELAALPKYGLMEFEGRYYDVVTITGRNGGLTQKLVEQETGEEILNHKLAYRANK